MDSHTLFEEDALDNADIDSHALFDEDTLGNIDKDGLLDIELLSVKDTVDVLE
jgi:hypothetical protein